MIFNTLSVACGSCNAHDRVAETAAFSLTEPFGTEAKANRQGIRSGAALLRPPMKVRHTDPIGGGTTYGRDLEQDIPKTTGCILDPRHDFFAGCAVYEPSIPSDSRHVIT